MTNFTNVDVVCTDNGGCSHFSVGQTYYVDGDGDIHVPDEGYRGVIQHSDDDQTGFLTLYGHTIEVELCSKVIENIQVIASNRNFARKKVNMIKRIREATNMGLKESKVITDSFDFSESTSNQEVVVEIPDRVYNQAAWNDVFRPLTSENSNTYQEIQDLAAKCVGNKEFFYAKRLIEILEDVG